MKKKITGTLTISTVRYRDGQPFYAAVERPGWGFYVGTTRMGSIPSRYERWRILARNKQEARKTCAYHFYASRWRLLP